MKFSDISVKELLPQRPPFLLVDTFLDYSEPDTVTSYTVPEDGVFTEDGLMLPAGIIENMAQSSALRIGYINKYILHQNVKVGFIGAVRNLRIFRRPKAGETIVTTVTAISEVFGITLVESKVRIGDEIIAEAALKTALGEKDAE